MASQGPLSTGTAADDSGTGAISWTNPGNATASDNSWATAALTSAGTQKSHWLKCTNFGFSIPAGATIDGIVFEAEASATSTSGAPVFASAVSGGGARIVKGGAISSTDRTSTGSPGTILSTTDAYYAFGGTTDLCGETWTPTDINASTFGCVFACSKSGAKTSTTAQIDHVRITVYYTATVSATGGFAARVSKRYRRACRRNAGRPR